MDDHDPWYCRMVFDMYRPTSLEIERYMKEITEAHKANCESPRLVRGGIEMYCASYDKHIGSLT